MEAQRHANGIVTWPFAFAGPGLLAAVTTRHGGVSDGVYGGANLGTTVGDDPARVAENRRLVAEALDVGALVIAHQRHTSNVALVDRDTDPVHLEGIDALVTVEPDVAIAVLAADCCPLVLADPRRGAVAVAHAGRLGVVLDVIGAVVEALDSVAGSAPGDLVVGVGPCISAAAYEIDGQALADVEAAFGGDLLVPTTDGRATFDLRGAVLRRLRDAGVRDDRIEVVAATTDGDPTNLWSDRAARPCGRLGVVAALRGADPDRR